MIDMRIDVGLPRHKKYRRLKRALEVAPMEYLITFWGAVAEQVPNGALNGWSNADIEDAAEWDGEPGVFCRAMIDAGFLDETAEGYYPHDWHDHQPWVAGAEERKAAARKAGKASAMARAQKFGTSQPNGTPNGPFENRSERGVERNSNPRTPSPSPTPIVNDDDDEKDAGADNNTSPGRPPGRLREGGSIALFVKAFRRQPNGFEQPILAMMETTHQAEALVHAFREAGERGATNLKYVEKVLEDPHDKRDGSGGKRTTHGKTRSSAGTTANNNGPTDWAGDMPAVGVG